MVAHLLCKQGVRGSSPRASTEYRRSPLLGAGTFCVVTFCVVTYFVVPELVPVPVTLRGGLTRPAWTGRRPAALH